MFSLILYLFIQLVQSEEEECKLKDAGGFVKFAHALAGPSQSIGNSIGSSLFEEEDDIITNAFGGVVYGGIFILFTIILVFWTLCTQCCACYKCCRPVRSEKPSICLIVLFSISAALMFFSIIVLYVSASNFTKTFKDFVNLSSDFNSSYDNLVNKITGAVYDIFDPINNTEKQIKQELYNLMNYINENANAQKENAEDSQNIIDKFSKSFNSKNNVDASNYITLRVEYGSDAATELNPLIDEPVKNGPAKDLIEIAQKMIDSNKELIDMANEMRNSFDDGGTFDEIESYLQQGYNGIDEVVGSLSTITDVLSSSSEYTDLISDYESLVRFCAYFIPTFVLLFLVGYVLSFIFKCCCSRCLLAWFHCAAFFVTIFVVLFSGIFGVFYGVLDSYCPKLLDLLVNEFEFGESLGISPENFTEMFLCTEKKSLMDLGLDTIIDINSVSEQISEVPGKLNNLLSFGDSFNGVKNKLDNFDKGFNFDQVITANGIIPNCESSLPELAQQKGYPKEVTIQKIFDLIHDKEKSLQDARTKMNECNQFSKEIIPRVDSTINTTNNLVGFVENTFDNIEDKVRELNCIDTRCVYASLKNPICGNLVAATGIWTIAAVTTIMGLMLMSCAICKRRRQFKNVTISPNDEYEGDGKELAGFSANDDLL